MHINTIAIIFCNKLIPTISKSRSKLEVQKVVDWPPDICTYWITLGEIVGAQINVSVKWLLLFPERKVSIHGESARHLVAFSKKSSRSTWLGNVLNEVEFWFRLMCYMWCESSDQRVDFYKVQWFELTNFEKLIEMVKFNNHHEFFKRHSLNSH